MKKIFFYSSVALISIGFFSCNSSSNNVQPTNGLSSNIVNIPSNGNNKGAAFTFTEMSHDFGNITQGEKVSYAFKFRNTGTSDLVISSAVGSCGCTVPEYPKGAIHAGADGVVNVVFDSTGKSGKVEKTVTLVTNSTPNTTVITIAANIIVPSENK
ncbi:MAG TPA: DUF1573 domain-containing protein [Bacteroidia bacterium]|nr:DUF1573 domain-containing protein [Bacteroidia bacterium]